MRIGLLADIHEHVDNLRKAISNLQAERVDLILSLGDFCENGVRLEETCSLLQQCQSQGLEVQGVWGNHDFGLCQDAVMGCVRGYPDSVIQFAAQQRDRIQIGDYLFMHIEPWLDPNSLADLWFYEGLPGSRSQRERVFQNKDFRVAIIGHYHRWWVTSQHAPLSWDGQSSLELASGRHLVVVDGVVNGCWAILDTSRGTLEPRKAA